MNGDDEFFIGWQGRAPGRTGRRLVGIAIGLALVAAATVWAMAAMQRTIGAASWDYANTREFTGVLRCREDEADILMAFARDRKRKFWFLRPDNGELCIARWAPNGDPAPRATNATTIDYQLGLVLQLA